MGRVVNTNDPGKRRNALMRDGAELLRHLMLQTTITDEAKDMLAQLVYTLREVDEGIEESAKAWEKRDYWMKAEEFRARWMWAGSTSDELRQLIRREDWAVLPMFLVKLMPKFSEVTVTKFTRDESLWRGAYMRLKQEPT
ncbi:MAG: hypothetical protein MUF38_07920 [Anaerolineae bacterium]|jgi:hypothetical protein|nr:hypothetical protein [Anaerolineae bacterium]